MPAKPDNEEQEPPAPDKEQLRREKQGKGKPVPAEMPAPVRVGLTPEQIEEILARYGEVERDALRSLLADARLGKFTAQKLKMLVDAGLWIGPAKSEKTPAESNKYICDSQDELRSRIMIHYQAKDGGSLLRREISKQEISEWTKSKRLHGVPPPPKAIEGGRKNRYSLNAWLEWFEMHKRWTDEFKRDDTQPGRNDGVRVIPMGELREITERAELEHSQWEIQRDMGKYVTVEHSGRICGGALRQNHDWWKSLLEGNWPEQMAANAQALNVEPEKIAGMLQFWVALFRSGTDFIESQNEKMAHEVEEKLKAEANLEKK